MSGTKIDALIAGLALSGGGFRATLFHLGVIQHLREVGLLAGIRVISSVSGGSVVAAHLVLNWHRYTGPQADFEWAKADLVQFTRRDIRGRVVRRLPFCWLIRPLTRTLLRSHGNPQPSATWLLSRYYNRWLFHGATLQELPPSPRLHILATNLTRGCLTSFGQTTIVHFPSERSEVPTPVEAGLTDVALAVTASSSYPALFPPLSLNHEDVGAKESTFERQFFTDAGVTDNLGVQAIDWADVGQGERVLVSDAGQSFVVPHYAGFGILKTALMAADLMMFRIRESALSPMRQADSRVLLLSISDCDNLDGAAPVPVQQPLEALRTDLDAFSAIEAEELVRHGYFRSEAATGLRVSGRPEFRFDSKVAAARARHLIA